MSIKQLLGGASARSLGAGLAGGLASGLLLNAVGGKKARKFAGSALKLGGAAVVGGMAYKAYERYRQNDAAHSGVSAESRGGSVWQRLSAGEFLPQTAEAASGMNLLIMRSMIAAAHADNHMDANEQRLIMAQLDTMELSQQEKAMVFDEFRNPLSLEDLAALATRRELAVEIYAAAALVLDENVPAAGRALDELAARLELPADLVAELNRSTADPGFLKETVATAERQVA